MGIEHESEVERQHREYLAWLKLKAVHGGGHLKQSVSDYLRLTDHGMSREDTKEPLSDDDILGKIKLEIESQER